MRDASICGLGQTASSAIESAIKRFDLSDEEAPHDRRSPDAIAARRRRSTLTIDGSTVSVPEGTTILDACDAQGIDTPTLCYLETLTPVNACRVCVVEVEGARVLVPACSRKVEPGMVVQTDTRARAAQPASWCSSCSARRSISRLRRRRG